MSALGLGDSLGRGEEDCGIFNVRGKPIWVTLLSLFFFRNNIKNSIQPCETNSIVILTRDVK